MSQNNYQFVYIPQILSVIGIFVRELYTNLIWDLIQSTRVTFCSIKIKFLSIWVTKDPQSIAYDPAFR